MNLAMIEEFLDKYFVVIYGITLLAALFKYSRYYDTPFKFLPILILYTFLNELLGGLVRQNSQFSLFINDSYSWYNMIIYNIYIIVFYLYFYYLYRHYIENEKHKKLIVYGGALFILIALINPFVQDFRFEGQAFAYVLGGIVLITCSMYYFNGRRKNSKLIFEKTDLLSWISLGLILFYLGYLPIKILRYYNAMEGISEDSYVRKTHLSLIIIMYGCFILGFLFMRRIQPPEKIKM